MRSTYSLACFLAIPLLAATPVMADTLFSEDFESPDVSANSSLQFGATIKKGAVPDNGNWIGSTQGFGADRFGLINKAHGDYTAPAGNEQGMYFGYTNSGLTTSTGSIIGTLELEKTYTVSCDVARDNDSAESSYMVQLVAFGVDDGDALRKDVRPGSRPGVVLEMATGTVTTNDLSTNVTFNFTADAVDHASELGKTLGIRLIGNATHPIYDNVLLSSDGAAAIPDSDGDGMLDVWEITHFGDLSHDGTTDSDGDGLTDLFEFQVGLDPTKLDTDGDGNPDWVGYLQSENEIVLLTETFEAPDVIGSSTTQYGATYDQGSLPGSGKWVGSSTGFGAGYRGLIHQNFGDFTAPIGNQGYYFAYTNSGLTSSSSAILHTLKAGTIYTLSFDVARDNDKVLSNYRMELVAFDVSEGDSARSNATGVRPGVVLASKVGTVTTNDLSEHVVLVFQADAALHAAEIGKSVGVRFLGDSSHPILDNVELRAVESDSDGDGLLDDWEIANFGDLSHDGTADSDSDMLTDAFEFQANLDPNNDDTDGDGNLDWIGVPGYLSADEWSNLPGDTLADLYGSTAFYGAPSQSYYLSKVKSITDLGDDYGIRLRGTLKAPYTGDYRFWVAGDGESALYLSTDATPFHRRKIASVAVASSEEGWDESPGQKSGLISLVEGQEYYIEVLMNAGADSDHLAVAWEYFAQQRQIIPGSALKSFVPNPDDLDDDGMLDSWETQVGLDPSDNGSTVSTQSGYLDPDNDGLLNFEEYAYNGKPFTAGGHAEFLEWDMWTGLPGSTIQNLVLSPDFTEMPDLRSWVGVNTGGWGLNYGGRLRGTIIPTESGDYHFHIAGNDAAELWLSSTAERFDKQRIAWTKGSTAQQQWDASSSQKSSIMSLQAGQPYYIEALVKNESGTDHLALAWSKLMPATATWTTSDIGLTTPATWTENADSVSISSQGGDVWNLEDHFTFRHFQMTGDGVLTARVASINAVHEWAKVGLMVRGSLDGGSQNAMVLRTGNFRIVHQARSTANGITLSGYRTDPLQPDTWLRIARVGNTIYAYSSDNGVTWKQVAKGGVSLPNTVYFGLAVSGVADNAVDATFDNISITQSSAIELLPASTLTSITPNSNDLDDDNLPDDWETQMGLNATTAAAGMGQYGDPDGDGVNNLQEYQFGGHPLQFDGVPGNLTRELWASHTAGTIYHFVRSPEFQLGPDEVSLLPASEFQMLDEEQGFGQRVRGRVVAPVTGWYRFWISGNRDFELWLSSDSTKFNKRKVATALQWGDGDDVQSTQFRDWDQVGCQASAPIFLNEGEEYFIEILHKDVWAQGHFSVAWSYTDQTSGATVARVLINPSQLRTYAAAADDGDDDYLPDSWETTYGLNPQDNGYGDANDGEYGDFDGDLLSNHDEWLLGTNPASADTDGDGYDDYRELNVYGSDPTVTDLAPPTLVAQFDLSTFGESAGDWYVNADGGLSSTVRRGFLTYTIEVTEAGVYLLEISGRPEGIVRSVEEIPVVVSIDGVEVVRTILRSVDGAQGMAELLTPWLTSGNHTVTILNDNYEARRRLCIDSVRLLKPGGTDDNGDGIADWVAKQIVNGNGVTVCPGQSYVSPACIEGKARFFEQLTITADGEATQATRGINGGWYANVNLIANESQPVALDFSFDGGFVTDQRTLVWKATDVITAGEMTIRKGDSLRLTALPDIGPNDPHSIKVTLAIDGLEVASDFKASDPQTYTFDTTGKHTIHVFCRHGKTRVEGAMIVNVMAADFGEPFNVLANTSRTWDLPDVDSEAHIESDDSLGFFEIDPAADGYRRFRVDPNGPGEKRVIARTAEGGSILDYGEVHGYRSFRTDATGDITIIQTYPNGDRVVMMSVVLPDGLPPGGFIRLKIFVAGVTFLDGTIEKILSAENFDVNGIAYVKFNFPAGTLTSVCHNLTMHDGEGVEIGQQ